MEKSFDGK